VLRQVDAVVRGPRLLAERDDLVGLLRIERDEALAETMAHHAVADDDNGPARSANHSRPSIRSCATSTAPQGCAAAPLPWVGRVPKERSAVRGLSGLLHREGESTGWESGA